MTPIFPKVMLRKCTFCDGTKPTLGSTVFKGARQVRKTLALGLFGQRYYPDTGNGFRWFRGKGIPPGELETKIAFLTNITANGLDGCLRPPVKK